MSSHRHGRDDATTAREAGRSAYRATIDVLFAGFAVVVPLVITIYVLEAILEFVADALQPLVGILEYLGIVELFIRIGAVRLLVDRFQIFPSASAFLSELVAAIFLLALIVGVGVITRNRYGERLVDVFDMLIVSLPGIGAVYKSFRRMSDVMLESDVRNFRDVKLVEFPHEGSYVIGFETNTAPESVHQAVEVDGEMMTLFIPFAPNPVMGGFLAHIPSERVRDVDMSVEEGIRSIITSGVGVDESTSQIHGLHLSDLEEAVVPESLEHDEETEAESETETKTEAESETETKSEAESETETKTETGRS